MSFAITRGLSQAQRGDAARLYWQAFRSKLGRVLGPETKALGFIEKVLCPDHVLAAVDPDGTVVGVVGFRTPAGSFVGGSAADLAAHYGRFGALWRNACLSVIARDLRPGELVVDGLVVRSDRRGERIGAALMLALLAEARARGYSEVRLDVIGENIRARALYDQLGFAVAQRQESRLTRLIFNYKSAVVMVRRL
jgi:ribosomal protein S18 acetylase RimI-like enzyme